MHVSFIIYWCFKILYPNKTGKMLEDPILQYIPSNCSYYSSEGSKWVIRHICHVSFYSSVIYYLNISLCHILLLCMSTHLSRIPVLTHISTHHLWLVKCLLSLFKTQLLFLSYSTQPFFILILKKNLSFFLIVPYLSSICHTLLTMLHHVLYFPEMYELLKGRIYAEL